MLVKDKLEKLKAEIKVLEALTIIFPDIQEYTDRWSRTHLCSPSVNSIAEEVHFVKSCGCCNDCAIYARYFLTFNNITVYSEPKDLTLGYRTGSYCGKEYEIYDTWEEQFYKYNINPKLKEKVQNYIRYMERAGFE